MQPKNHPRRFQLWISQQPLDNKAPELFEVIGFPNKTFQQ